MKIITNTGQEVPLTPYDLGSDVWVGSDGKVDFWVETTPHQESPRNSEGHPLDPLDPSLWRLSPDTDQP